MNANPDKLSVPDGDPAAAESHAGEAKPVRRRRAPKAVAEAAAVQSPPIALQSPLIDEPGERPSVPESEAPAKPRRRRSAVADNLAQDMAHSPEAPVAPVAQVAHVVQAAQLADGAASSVASRPATVEPSNTGAAMADFQPSERGPVDASATEAVVAAAGQDEGTALDAPRGERSRRRGRRDRNRGERGEAGQNNLEGSAGQMPEAPMPMVIPAEAGERKSVV